MRAKIKMRHQKRYFLNVAVIEAISNPFDVMQGNSFGGHVPACKCHKLSNAITNQARQ